MKILKIAMVLSIISLLGFSTMAQSYTILPKLSKVKWLAKKVTGQHNGTVALKSGTVKVEGKTFTGEFVLNMNSIAVVDITDAKKNAKLKGHLESKDFFAVADYPEANLVITKVIPTEGDDNYTVTADLTIKGITNAITFPANVNFSNSAFNASASIVIDRSKWNVRYGSGSFFEGLGDKMIYNDITFDLTITSK